MSVTRLTGGTHVIRLVLAFAAVLYLAGSAAAQAPNQWHPYVGGRNCIQVGDQNKNFNCSPITTVDPATGNMVIGGTLTVGGGSSLYLLRTPETTASPGPGVGAVRIYLVRGPAGSCQLVVSGGDSFGATVIPTVNALGAIQTSFQGGQVGC